jgi:undecaprenyl-diphosphatase
MMTIHALILGAIQGLTEFLPISSSGHLVLIPYFFGWQYQGKAFDVALHAGTVVALLIYFWRDWLKIIINGFKKKNAIVADVSWPYPNNFLWMIVVASIPAAILGLALDKLAGDNLNWPIFIAVNLVIFGWLLWFVDKKAKSDLVPGKLTFGKAFIVGLFQSIALVPGVSRSGITLIGSRFIGLAREESARFAFLLGTPAIVGAFLLELPKIMKESLGLSFWIGVIAAVFFGVVAIKFLLNYLKKHDFSLFMWYRIALAVLVVIVFLVRF